MPLLKLSNLLLLLSFNTRKHTSMASRVIFANLDKEQRTQIHPQYLIGIVACTFSHNLSLNSCILNVTQSIKSCKKVEVRFEVYSITLNYIYKLKLGLGTFGKDYGSVLNVDQKDFFSQLL